MSHFFRPHTSPAREIYDAFQAAALEREGRTFEVWHAHEVNAVYDIARSWTRTYSLPAPYRWQIEACEKEAQGHADYGAKWAYAVARLLEKKPQ